MLIRPEDVKSWHFNCLIGLYVFLNAVTWGCCYAVSITEGKVTERVFFLSRALSYDPARVIANFFIPIIAYTSLIIMLLRVYVVSESITTVSQLRVVKSYVVVVFVWCIGMIAVSAFPYQVTKALHLCAAGVVFASGIILMALVCLIDYLTNNYRNSFRLHVFRLILITITFAMSVVAGATYFSHGQVSASFEIASCVLTLLFMISIARRDGNYATADPLTNSKQVTELPIQESTV